MAALREVGRSAIGREEERLWGGAPGARRLAEGRGRPRRGGATEGKTAADWLTREEGGRGAALGLGGGSGAGRSPAAAPTPAPAAPRLSPGAGPAGGLGAAGRRCHHGDGPQKR